MKESFIIYGEWERHFALLSPPQQGELVMALFAYNNRDEEPAGDPAVKMAFSFIRTAMDENAEKWEKKRADRSEAGRAGGLARASKSKQSKLYLSLYLYLYLYLGLLRRQSPPYPPKMIRRSNGRRM